MIEYVYIYAPSHSIAAAIADGCKETPQAMLVGKGVLFQGLASESVKTLVMSALMEWDINLDKELMVEIWSSEDMYSRFTEYWK